MVKILANLRVLLSASGTEQLDLIIYIYKFFCNTSRKKRHDTCKKLRLRSLLLAIFSSGLHCR